MPRIVERDRSDPGVIAFDNSTDVLRMGCVASNLWMRMAYEAWNPGVPFTHIDREQRRFQAEWGRLCREVFAAGLGLALETQRAAYAFYWGQGDPWHDLADRLAPVPAPTIS